MLQLLLLLVLPRWLTPRRRRCLHPECNVACWGQLVSLLLLLLLRLALLLQLLPTPSHRRRRSVHAGAPGRRAGGGPGCDIHHQWAEQHHRRPAQVRSCSVFHVVSARVQRARKRAPDESPALCATAAGCVTTCQGMLCWRPRWQSRCVGAAQLGPASPAAHSSSDRGATSLLSRTAAHTLICRPNLHARPRHPLPRRPLVSRSSRCAAAWRRSQRRLRQSP